MRCVRWFEQSGVTPVTKRCTIEKAVAAQKEAAARVHPNFKYESDEQALSDFLVVHWADVEEL
jgi:hypothetical protein